MPIRIADNLPARHILEQERIFVTLHAFMVSGKPAIQSAFWEKETHAQRQQQNRKRNLLIQTQK